MAHPLLQSKHKYTDITLDVATAGRTASRQIDAIVLERRSVTRDDVILFYCNGMPMH